MSGGDLLVDCVATDSHSRATTSHEHATEPCVIWT
nr:MAG TPA: hypothetical protein [Caudoviricetes sp.]